MALAHQGNRMGMEMGVWRFGNFAAGLELSHARGSAAPRPGSPAGELLAALLHTCSSTELLLLFPPFCLKAPSFRSHSHLEGGVFFHIQEGSRLPCRILSFTPKLPPTPGLIWKTL